MRKFYSLRKRLIYWREIEINNIKLSFVLAVVNLWLFTKWKKIKNKFWISYTFYEIVFCHAKWLSRRYINLNLEKTNTNLTFFWPKESIFSMVIRKLSTSELLLSVKVSMKRKLSNLTDSDVECLSENPSHLLKNDAHTSSSIISSLFFPSLG